jgi:hypothetical protein
VVCRKDRALLRAFSRRSVRRLEGHRRLLRLLRPFLSVFMDANIRKETEKDRLIIENGATLFARARAVDADEALTVFEKTKVVDRAFLRRMKGLPLSVHVDYDAIEPVRIRRIELILKEVGHLFRRWEADVSFEEAVQRTYTRSDFHQILATVLHLYNLETHIICRSVRTAAVPPHVIRTASDTLFAVLEEVAGAVAEAAVAETFRGEVKP